MIKIRDFFQSNKFATISSWLVGLVFIFSGFVKGVDPLGFAYKIEDYFIAFGQSWANDLALILAISLCTIEFTIGMALLLKAKTRLTSWVLLIVMLFFTVLTFNDALYSPVPDCGCFGDALKLTNWQTFYKNIVLMIFTVIVFYNRNRFKSYFSGKVQNRWYFLFVVGFVSFSMYNYRHLPLIDFTIWKEGKQITSDQPIENKVYVKYVNTNTQEEKEFLSPDYPWNDSAWMKEWQFVGQRIVSLGTEIDHSLFIEDESGNEFTSEILLASKMFVIVIPEIQVVKDEQLQKILQFTKDLHITDCQMVIITGSLANEIENLKKITGNQLDIYFADETVLKTIVRSNPGIILFNDGRLIKKWHFNDFPSISEIPDLSKVLN